MLRKLTNITTVLRSGLITSWTFEPDSICIRICGFYAVRIPYLQIQDCVIRATDNKLKLWSKSEQWLSVRAGIRRNTGTVYVLSCESEEGFIAALSKHAPHIKVRKINKKTRFWEWPRNPA